MRDVSKKMRSYAVVVFVGILVIAITIPFPAYAESVITVPGDFSTIQQAIDAASLGETIQVAAGTYTEQLTITKSLELEGAGATSTTIQAPSPLTPDSFGKKNIIEISTGAEVSISGFTVSGPGSSNCQSITAGIFVIGGAALKIEKTTITDISDTPAGGCQNGVGIRAGQQSLGEVGHAIIDGVTITKYQKGGIVIDGEGSTGTVENNVIDFGFTPFNIASNGIQVSRGAVATVADNEVTGNICAAPSCGPDLLNDDQATGILLFKAGEGTVVGDNKASNNDVGIFVAESSSGIQIEDNTVNNNPDAGIAFQDGIYTASDNKISGPGNVGIAVIASTVNTHATLKDNEISGVTTPIGTFAATGLAATFEVAG